MKRSRRGTCVLADSAPEMHTVLLESFEWELETLLWEKNILPIFQVLFPVGRRETAKSIVSIIIISVNTFVVSL